MVVLLALSAFFSASETSFTSVNMIRIRNMAEEGNRKAAAAVRLAESYDRTLSTILIGNNLVNIALSSLTTVAATTAFGDAGVAIATGVATLLILTFGEILPKSWAKENSEQLVLVIAQPLSFCSFLFYPLGSFFIWLRGAFGKKEEGEKAPSITEQELMYMVGAIQEEGVLEAGALTADVPVRALEAGAAGNISAGAIVSMAVAPMGIAACANPQPFAGGADGEGDEALRERVLDTFKRLPNGANAAFYEQEALSFDQVAAAAVVSRPRGVGSVDIVPATLAGVPDEALLDTLLDYFEERREIAVDLEVRAPETVTVNIQVQVEPEEGRNKEEVLDRVEAAVRGWFTGKLLGQDVLRARLGHLIYNCGGVANYVIAAPAADVPVEKDQLPILGTLSVEEKS